MFSRVSVCHGDCMAVMASMSLACDIAASSRPDCCRRTIRTDASRNTPDASPSAAARFASTASTAASQKRAISSDCVSPATVVLSACICSFRLSDPANDKACSNSAEHFCQFPVSLPKACRKRAPSRRLCPSLFVAGSGLDPG